MQPQPVCFPRSDVTGFFWLVLLKFLQLDMNFDMVSVFKCVLKAWCFFQRVHLSLRAASRLQSLPRQVSSHGVRLGLPQLGLNVDFPLSIPCFPRFSCFLFP